MIAICEFLFDKKFKPIKKVKKRHLNIDVKGICLATECSNGLIFYTHHYLLETCRLNIQKNKSKDSEKFNDHGVVILYINKFFQKS